MRRFETKIRWQTVALISMMWYVLFVINRHLEAEGSLLPAKAVFIAGLVLTALQYVNKGIVRLGLYDLYVTLFGWLVFGVINALTSQSISADPNSPFGFKWGWPLAWYKIYPNHQHYIMILELFINAMCGAVTTCVGNAIAQFFKRDDPDIIDRKAK